MTTDPHNEDGRGAGHTPGPWRVENYRGRANNMLRVVCGNRFSIGIARVNAGINDGPNANLIAAAPELLEALEFYANGIGHTEIEDGGAIARRAIAKALGQ